MRGAWEWRGGDMHHHHRAGTHVQRHLCDDRNMINAFHYSSVNQSSINTHNRRTHCTPLYVRTYVHTYICTSVFQFLLVLSLPNTHTSTPVPPTGRGGCDTRGRTYLQAVVVACQLLPQVGGVRDVVLDTKVELIGRQA